MLKKIFLSLAIVGALFTTVVGCGGDTGKKKDEAKKDEAKKDAKP